MRLCIHRRLAAFIPSIGGLSGARFHKPGPCAGPVTIAVEPPPRTIFVSRSIGSLTTENQQLTTKRA